MLRIARERISTLFALAEEEAASGHLGLSDRYIGLARRIGTRYNVRLPPEYRELYCRGCSRFWIEGRTVRTRLRAGRRVRTCLACGRVRRIPVRWRSPARSPPSGSDARQLGREELVPVELEEDDGTGGDRPENGAEEE